MKLRSLSSNTFAWPHRTGKDNRIPLFTVEYEDEAYGFYFLSILSWIEVLAFVVAEAVIAALTGALVYYTIVKPRREKKGPPLPGGVLAALGLFLPFWILCPRYALDAIDVENKIVRFALSVITPTVSIFRTIEALFGFTPAYATQSLRGFVLTFGSPMILQFDDSKSNKFVCAPPAQVIRHLLRFVGFLFLTGMFLSSFFCLTTTPALADPSTRAADYYSLRRLANLSQWKDTMFYSVLFQLVLCTFGEGLVFATTLLTGIRAHRLMDNPMFESKSPSDFWGRRWNLLIHRVLKQGVYKPVRSLGGSKACGVACVFLASGLFHEWLLPTNFFDYRNVHGPTMLFFAWQVVLVAGESMVGHWVVFSYISKSAPGCVRTMLVLLLGLPVGHWFTDSYVHSDFFRQMSVLMPCFLPQRSS